MLEIKNMSFSYDDNIIYSDTTLTLKNNGIYYLDSPNGTGKSTLFKILKNELTISGEIIVDGIKKFDKQITYIDYNKVIEHRLSVIDQISLFCDDNSYIDELLTKFKLYDLKDRMAKKLSDGERARFIFLLGILEDSPIILLDEAFAHLDEENMEIIRDVIYSLAHDKIIIYTSHKDRKVIEYNYKILINDKKLILKEEEFINNYQKLTLKKPNYNKKILKKAIEYSNRYIFLFILSILIVISTLFFNLTKISSLSIDKAFINKSYNIPYTINKFNDYLITKNIEIPYIENINNDEYVIKTKNIDSDYIFNIYNINKKHVKTLDDYDFHFNIENVYILNKFHDITLLDDEIIMTDFLYLNLKFIEFNDGSLFNEINNELYLNFNDRKIKVKYIINTGYEKLLKKYYDENKKEIKNLILNEKDYVINRNYFYKSLYMNENTFKNLNNDKYNLYSNYTIYNNSIGQNNYKEMKFDIKDNYNEQLLDGKIPENENEILINRKLIDSYFTGDYYLNTNLYFTDYLVNEDNAYKYCKKTFGKKYKVSGIIDGDIDIVFFDNNSKFNYFKSEDSYYKSNILTNLNEDKLSIILDDKYSFCCDNYSKLVNVKIQNEEMKLLNYVIFYFLLTLSILSIIIYYSLEKKYYLNDLKVLFSKNIDENLIKNVKNKFLIKNIIFTLFLVIIMLILVYYFNILNIFINLLFGLKDYNFI